MSNNNQGDKPQITQGEWMSTEKGVRTTGGYICSFSKPFKYEGQEDRFKQEIFEYYANIKMIALAGNLHQKYGSLETLEQRMIEAEAKVKQWEEDFIREANDHTEIHDSLKKRVKELEEENKKLTHSITNGRY